MIEIYTKIIYRVVVSLGTSIILKRFINFQLIIQNGRYKRSKNSLQKHNANIKPNASAELNFAFDNGTISMQIRRTEKNPFLNGGDNVARREIRTRSNSVGVVVNSKRV